MDRVLLRKFSNSDPDVPVGSGRLLQLLLILEERLCADNVKVKILDHSLATAII